MAQGFCFGDAAGSAMPAIARADRPQICAADNDVRSLLLRRVVPHLRARRPSAVIEA